MKLLMIPLLLLAVPIFCASATSEEERHGKITPQGEKGAMRNPVVSGPTTGGKKDITDSNDVELAHANDFATKSLTARSSELHFVLFKAEVQVVAGLMYTLRYKGNDGDGVCQEEHIVVVYTKPWLDERLIKSDTTTVCGA